MASHDLTSRREGHLGNPFFAPLSSFRRELDRLFDEFLVPGDDGPLERTLQPNIELREKDGAYMLVAELPGLDQKDVQVDFKDNILTIAGEKREARDENEQGRHYSERSYGRFERRIPLDEEVDADKIEAKFTNGLLTVTLPKDSKAKDKGRHIQINS